ncbi:META domain-containing protein [Thalassotalea castellviae]|uniref:META domain-containing protein n=1 Tax=Thalassotalea castellviae TaxID=3075612 RepID=A0ABU3A2Z4_9GAMM|nr:META domain-containing protein [Thalassotalea sp. W431]MDT0604537.1 META domain-containing protein [Thalassotalea sp. W431]
MLKIALILSSLLFFMACTHHTATSSSDTLAIQEQKNIFIENTWWVETIYHKPLFDNVNITLRVVEKNKISGKSGCNQYASQLTIDENKISIDKSLSTRMACSPLLMKSEHLYLNALALSTKYQIDSAGHLTFFDAQDNQTITFNRGKKTSEKSPSLIVHYTCERDTSLTVSFVEHGSQNSDDNMAIVTLSDNKSVTLPQTPSASGFLYTNGKFSLQGKADNALWTVGRMKAMRCKTIM